LFISKGGTNSGNPLLYPDTKREKKENSMSGWKGIDGINAKYSPGIPSPVKRRQRKFYERVRLFISKGGTNFGNPLLYPDMKREKKENSTNGKSRPSC